MRFQVQTLEKYLKSKNDHEKPLGALNQVRMDGLVGGDQKGPSIFFIWNYINKQDVLIPKLAIKDVNDFCIGLKISFLVWGQGSHFPKLP